ncbi:MAG TPA: carboxypeptidase-like regulatory domain-containing protein, partial [Segetibacter sp.]
MKKTLNLILSVMFLCPGFLFAQDINVTGKVTGPGNENLSGVNVTISGTNRGTVTNESGNFSINAPRNATLIFSFVGYIEQRVNAGSRNVINVKLATDTRNLQDVVVTALGIRKESKRLGYATATVNADQISTNRTPNVASGLQGKLAGVNISTMGTGPAGSAKIRIRGQSSFSSQNSPLIVINGVPMDNTNFGIG